MGSKKLRVGIIILSGGKGARAGGKDKGWCLYDGNPLIKIVIEQLEQQLQKIAEIDFKLVISANRNLADYEKLGYAVVSDERTDYCGPLAGIESVLKKHQQENIARWLVYPVDSALVPDNYISLMLSIAKTKTGYLQQGQQKHFAHLSIDATQQPIISNYLDKNQRSIKGWLQEINAYPIHLIGLSLVKNFNGPF